MISSLQTGLSISKKIVTLLFFVVIMLNHQPLQAQTAVSKSVPVIELTGDAYSRGLQHGTALKKEITEVYAKWKENVRRNTGRDADSVLTEFRGSINFEPITRKYIPAILEEIKGIAKGSGQSYEDVYAFQLVDEFWIYLDEKAHTTNHHCSGMGVAATANHPAYVAQNLDLENFMHGYQVLFHLPASANRPEQYILSCTGLVALSGMNAKGIAVCLNTLMELRASGKGLPVAFVIRALLEKNNGSEALQFIEAVPHASGQNYILGITDSVYNFEASGAQVIRYLPKGTSGAVVYHTNHALVNHDVKPWYKNYHQAVLAGSSSNGNSEIRLATLQQLLNKDASDINTTVIKNVLRSKENARNPVCRTYREGGGGFTFSSLIYTTSGKRSVQLTYGSPDQSDYEEYFFAEGK